ncbi:hypothetical protein ACYSNR_07895 [Enterococcus sp. LJL128]|uniref:hypothetical protein n=1 Tax=Enterococcus sp. LJL51 TaxID=3416656 RepID=UPI003CE83B0E
MKKGVTLSLLGICCFLLMSCSTPDKKTTATSSSETTSSTTIASNEAPAQASITAQEVVQKFKDAGLAVYEERDMTQEDYGLAPMKAATGVIFGVYYSEYTASYLNGRVTVYTNLADLQEVKKFYDDLSAEDPKFKSWTAVNEEKLVLFQMNGGIDEAAFNEFQYVLGTL